jgi:thioredoxin 1
MGHAVQQITDPQFGELTKRQGIALVDFWAPWCGPCRMQAPVLEEVAAEVGASATIAKINVDEDGTHAGRLGIQSIPTLLLFKDGREIARFTGLQDKATLVQAVQQAAAA